METTIRDFESPGAGPTTSLSNILWAFTQEPYNTSGNPVRSKSQSLLAVSSSVVLEADLVLTLLYTYGVCASQLIRYARCCSNYSNFLSRHRALVTRLLSHGYKVNRLSDTFKKFYGIHTDLVGQYKKNVCQMFADSIS